MPSPIAARARIVALGATLAVGADVLPAPAAASAQAPAPRVASSEATALSAAGRALAAGDLARAFDLGTAYLKQHPADPNARVLLARIHIAGDEPAAAYDQLARALRTDPRHIDALYYLGQLTGELAAEEFERLLRTAPASARAHQLQAESLEAQDRRTEAEQAFEAALAADPELLDVLLGLARLKRIRLDCDGAVALYLRAEAIRPGFDAAYGLGSCYQRQGRSADAVEQFNRAVKRDPRAAVGWVGLGSALLGVGRTREAFAPLERAIVLEPAMGEAYYMLGRAYQAAGDRVRAQSAYDKAEAVTRNPPPDGAR